MVVDLLESWLTRAPRPVRALGFLREAAGIRRRAAHCRVNWKEHLDQCQAQIVNSIHLCPTQRKAVIFGAGLLHDLPIQTLAEKFQHVYLVDIVHPFFSRRSTKSYTNVHRIQSDITNTINDVYEASDDPDRPLPLAQPTMFLDDPEVDLILSLNILSQLPCLPIRYLKKWGAHSAAKIEAYARNLIAAHLDYMQRFGGRTLLITDTVMNTINLEGKLVKQDDLLYGMTLPPSESEWEWRLAPAPEVNRHFHYFRKVVCIARAGRS